MNSESWRLSERGGTSRLSKILVIDTATKNIYLSLVIDGVEKQSVFQEGINNHSVTIIPFLDEMLKKESVELKEIDEIIIGIGPGSYTGVRIGVTVAKMIGYMNATKVKTISSLALIASASEKEFVIPYVDARRGNAFLAAFRQVNGKLEYIEFDMMRNVEEYLRTWKFDYDFISEGHPKIQKILNSDLLETVDNVNDLQPNYLRITEAERNKNEDKN